MLTRKTNSGSASDEPKTDDRSTTEASYGALANTMIFGQVEPNGNTEPPWGAYETIDHMHTLRPR